mgnify:CR=1 FL=1
MLSLIPFPYRILALCGLAIALFGYGWVKGAAHGEARLEAFKQAAAVEAGRAQALADARTLADKQRKEASDASYQKALALAGADIQRMRDAARADTYVVPASAPAAGSPDRACFNRAELDAAIRGFAEEAAVLVSKGATARLKLDEAIKWGAR